MRIQSIADTSKPTFGAAGNAGAANPAAEIALPSRLQSLLHYLALLAMMGLAGILVLFRLDFFPSIWFDEGWWLQIPKNLVLYGEYASRSSEGFRHTDTIISASPAYFGMIAGAFELWGVGLWQARFAVALCFLACCVLVYLIGRKLYGRTVGLVALALFVLIKPIVSDNFTSALVMGRMAMPEIPSLLCFLAGVYVWLRAFDLAPDGRHEGRRRLMLIVTGILLGLACTVKSQFLLIVLPTLVVLGGIDLLYFRQRRIQYFVLPLLVCGAMIGLNQAFIFLILGSENYAKFLSDFTAASGPQVRVLFSPKSMASAVSFFLSSSYTPLLVPAVIYAAALCLNRTAADIRRCFLVVFVLGWFAWFTFASVAWARYAFPALAVSHILVAALWVDLARKLIGALSSSATHPTARLGVRAGVWVVLALVIATSAWPLVRDVARAQETPAQQLAKELDKGITDDSVIETWEWEIAFLAGPHNFHHPPTLLLNTAITRQQFGQTGQTWDYDFLAAKPRYLIIGPFGKWVGLYSAEFLQTRCTKMASVGEYDIYQVNGADGA